MDVQSVLAMRQIDGATNQGYCKRSDHLLTNNTRYLNNVPNLIERQVHLSDYTLYLHMLPFSSLPLLGNVEGMAECRARSCRTYSL